MTEPDWNLKGGIWTPGQLEPAVTPVVEPVAVTADDDVYQHLTLVFLEHLGLCGCGDPGGAWRLLLDLLEHFDSPDWEQAGRKLTMLIGTPPAIHFVLSSLDHAELIEHGSSIGYSWLTAKGKWVLWALSTVGVEDLDDRLDEHGYPHYDGKGSCAECTEDCWRITEVDSP
jgi:hypothetical protein